MILLLAALLHAPAARAAVPAETGSSVAVAPDLVARYDAIRVSLVADKLDAAQAAARDLAAGSADDLALQAAATAVATAPTIDAARSAFGELSRLVVTRLAAASPAPKLVVYHCPMFQGFAWWIQPKAGIANPYMGQEMPGCGEEMSLKAAAKDAAKGATPAPSTSAASP